MNYVLLLGAGFSRNWGGWLAAEAFEYLLGCPQIDENLRNLLWKKRHGGFEAALAKLQKEHFLSGKKQPDAQLTKLQNAILQMFKDMDEAFKDISFESHNEREYQIREFLVRFDAIFTLNQDLLLERHYLNGNVELSNSRRWNGWQIPGMRLINTMGISNSDRNLGKWEPDSNGFKITPNCQPYFKLHGSSNWVDSESRELLVLGANKVEVINLYPVLKYNFEQFKKYLSQPDTRLMVIGYGFGDDHINDLLKNAAANGNLHFFVIDPLGVDVIEKNPSALTDIMNMPPMDKLAASLWPYAIGSSRRSLGEIFGKDRVEHGKVMRFFSI